MDVGAHELHRNAHLDVDALVSETSGQFEQGASALRSNFAIGTVTLQLESGGGGARISKRPHFRSAVDPVGLPAAKPDDAMRYNVPPAAVQSSTIPTDELLMLEYTIVAESAPSALAIARCKDAEIVVDTDPAGRPDAFNPAELLLTAVAGCMLKGIERVAPMLHFQWRGANVRVHGVRQDVPPRLLRVDYKLLVDTDESEARLELLHRNLRNYGTIYNTIAGAVELTGTVLAKPKSTAAT